MSDRTAEENHIIELTVTKILVDEAIHLYKAEDDSYNALLELLAHGKGETLVRLYDAMRADLREALQFARQELEEAADKLHVSHLNHPGDARMPKKDVDNEMLYVVHAREDKERLLHWSDRASKAAQQIKEVLSK